MAFCPHCGAAVPIGDAKFCVACGKHLQEPESLPVPEQDGVQPDSPNREPIKQFVAEFPGDAKDERAFSEQLLPTVRTIRNKVGLGIWGAVLFIILATTGWRLFEGMPLVYRSNASGGAGLLPWLAGCSWGFIACYARFKWWRSAVLGIGIGWALYFGGLNLREEVVRHRFLVAAEQIDPVDAKAFRDAGDNYAKKNEISGRVVLAALRIAPDWAVMNYWNKKTDILYDPIHQQPECAGYVRPGNRARQSLTRGDELELEWLTVSFTQAAAEAPTPFTLDEKRGDKLTSELGEKGVLIDTDESRI